MSDMGAAHGPEHREPAVEHTGFRLSWGAIFAGMFIATALHIVLGLAGLAIGFGVWEPGQRVDTLGAGLGIWAAVSGIIALFVGGMATGRLAGILTRMDGALHGAVLWALATVVAAWMITSGVGAVIGGALGLVGQTASAAVSGIGQIGATVVGQVDVEPGEIRMEVEQALRQTGDPALQPDTLAAEAQRLRERATGPEATDAVVNDIMATIRERGGRIDRDAIINVITARTDLSRPEAERLADRIENMAGGLAQRAEEIVDTAGAVVGQVAEEASAAVAGAAWWALLAIGLSLASAVGGVVIRARD